MIDLGCTHEGNDVFSPQALTLKFQCLSLLNPDEIQSANLYAEIRQRISAHGHAKVAERLRGRLQIYYTPVQVRTLAWVIAAIAFGKHLDSFRTQKLSRITYHTVLRYASPRELWCAAIILLHYHTRIVLIDISPGAHAQAGCSGHHRVRRPYRISFAFSCNGDRTVTYRDLLLAFARTLPYTTITISESSSAPSSRALPCSPCLHSSHASP